MALSPEALPREELRATGPGEHAAFNAVYGRPTRPIEMPNILAVRLARRVSSVRDYLKASLREQFGKAANSLKGT